MKRKVILMTLVVLGLVFSGMAGAEEITIVGTGDGVAVLGAVGEAFRQGNPDVTINIPESIGSGGGIKAVGTDQYQIGRVAREIKEKEEPYGLSYVPYAKVPTVFFVNKNVAVQDLSAQQICDIFSGAITNWKEVGGKDAKIRVVRREENDSSFSVLLKTFPGFKDITITSRSKTAFSTPENFSIIEDKPDTIGFGPYDVAKEANVNVLMIDGKKPTDSDYPSFTTLAFIFKDKNKTGSIEKFVDFATSEAAHEAIKSAGGIPF